MGLRVPDQALNDVVERMNYCNLCYQTCEKTVEKIVEKLCEYCIWLDLVPNSNEELNLIKESCKECKKRIKREKNKMEELKWKERLNG